MAERRKIKTDELVSAAIQGCHILKSLEHRNVIVTMTCEAALKGHRATPEAKQHKDFVADVVEDKLYNHDEKRDPIVEICLINMDKKDRIPEGFHLVTYLKEQKRSIIDQPTPAHILQGTGTKYGLCARRRKPGSAEVPLTDIRIKSVVGQEARAPKDDVPHGSHTLEYTLLKTTYTGEPLRMSDPEHARSIMWTKYGSAPLMEVELVNNRNMRDLIALNRLTCVEYTGEGHLADLNAGVDDPAFLCLQNDLTSYRFPDCDIKKVVNLKYITPLLISLHQRNPTLARNSLKCLQNLLLLKFLRLKDKEVQHGAIDRLSRAVAESINICEVPRRSKDGKRQTCQQIIASKTMVILTQMFFPYHTVDSLWGFLLASTRIIDTKYAERFVQMFADVSIKYLRTRLKAQLKYQRQHPDDDRKQQAKPPTHAPGDRSITGPMLLTLPEEVKKTGMKFVAEELQIILSAVDPFHERVQQAVKTLCHKLFPGNARAAWPFVCLLLFVGRFAGIPHRREQDHPAIGSLIKFSVSMLGQVLQRVIKQREPSFLEIESIKVLLRGIYPRVIARNYMNRTLDAKTLAAKGMEFLRLIACTPAMCFMRDEIHICLDQVVLPHLEQPGFELRQRYKVVNWLCSLIDTRNRFPLDLFYEADVMKGEPLLERIITAASQLALDCEEYAWAAVPKEAQMKDTDQDSTFREARSLCIKSLSLLDAILRQVRKILRNIRHIERPSVPEYTRLLKATEANDDRRRKHEEGWDIMVKLDQKGEDKGARKCIEHLVKNEVLENNTEAISAFLIKNQHVMPKAQLGAFLGGKRSKEENPEEEEYRMGFFKGIELEYGKDFEQSVGDLFTGCGFRLPKESNPITRICETWGRYYYEREPFFFDDADGVEILLNALLMLNTSLHNPSVKKSDKMTLNQWISTVSGIEQCKAGFSREDIIRMFKYIQNNEYQIKFETDELTRASATSQTDRPSMVTENEAVFMKIAAKFFKTCANEFSLKIQTIPTESGPGSTESLHDLTQFEIIRAMFKRVWPRLEATVKEILSRQDSRSCPSAVHIAAWCLVIAIRLKEKLAFTAFQKALSTFWKSVRRRRAQISGKGAFKAQKNDKILQDLEDLHLQHNSDRSIKQACHAVFQIQKRITNQFDNWKNQEKLEELQECFGTDYNIVSLNREYVGDGHVEKISRDAKKQSYQLFLFNDILVYAAHKGPNSFQIHKVLQLALSNVGEPVKANPNEHAFVIENPIKDVTFIVETKRMKEKYLASIHEQIKNSKKRAAKVMEVAKRHDARGLGHLVANSAAFLGKSEEDILEEIESLRPQVRKNSDPIHRGRTNSYNQTDYELSAGSSSKTFSSKVDKQLQEETHCHLCLLKFSRMSRLVKGRYMCKTCQKHVCKGCWNGKGICRACNNITALIKDIQRYKDRGDRGRRKDRKNRKDRPDSTRSSRMPELRSGQHSSKGAQEEQMRRRMELAKSSRQQQFTSPRSGR